MNVEIITNKKIFRGKLLSNIDNITDTLSILCSFSKTEITIKLYHPYQIIIYEEMDKTFSRFIEYCKLAKSCELFSKIDKKYILNSLNPHIEYCKLRAIRELGLSAMTKDEIDIKQLKNNILNIISDQYNEQLKYIEIDDELILSEKEYLINITNEVFEKYKNFLNTSSNISEILRNWPSLFAEKLEFNNYLID